MTTLPFKISMIAELPDESSILEAAYLVCAENEQMMQQVLEIAKERRQQRREAGIQRRAKAMSKYLPEK